jgi:hypothetical protein
MIEYGIQACKPIEPGYWPMGITNVVVDSPVCLYDRLTIRRDDCGCILVL